MTNTTTITLPQAIKDAASRYAQHTAIRFLGRDTSFAVFDQATDRIAGALAGQGIGVGDRVALYCVNSDIFALAYLGIVKAGATVLPLNLMLKPNELEYILNDASAKALIYHEAFADNVSAFRNNVPSLQWCVAIGEKKSQPDDAAWPALLNHDLPAPQPNINPANDVVSILYTSGTTGKPKGAMLTHCNLVSDVRGVHQALHIAAGEDRILVVLPMFHAFAATVGMLLPLLSGCCMVPVPRFEPALVMDTIAESGATIFLGVPSMYTVLMNLPDEQLPKFDTVRFCVSGGAAMPQELMKRFEARFNKFIYEGDGPTECGPVTCVNPIGGVRKPASVGLPIPGVEMRIVDLQGNELPNDEVGEICVRGANVMKGYWNRQQDTAESFFGDWFRTGDLGYRDADGYFYIVDRIKDMVIVNGMNVYPRVVEELLYQFALVQEAAVVGEPHELHGEIPVAFVVLKAGMQADAASVRAFCRERLGSHQVPRKVIFLDALPKNAAGKILKRELRKHGELERGVDSRSDESA
jgi:long-chain acyl-CoA synthetase